MIYMFSFISERPYPDVDDGLSDAQVEFVLIPMS